MRFHRERIYAHGLEAAITDRTLYAWFIQEQGGVGVLKAGLDRLPAAAAWSSDYVRRQIDARFPRLDIKTIWIYDVPLGNDGRRANIALIEVPAGTPLPQ